MKRVLLVSHELSYTGAPVALLNLAKILKNLISLINNQSNLNSPREAFIKYFSKESYTKMIKDILNNILMVE